MLVTMSRPTRPVRIVERFAATRFIVGRARTDAAPNTPSTVSVMAGEVVAEEHRGDADDRKDEADLEQVPRGIRDDRQLTPGVSRAQLRRPVPVGERVRARRQPRLAEPVERRKQVLPRLKRGSGDLLADVRLPFRRARCTPKTRTPKITTVTTITVGDTTAMTAASATSTRPSVNRAVTARRTLVDWAVLSLTLR